MRNVCARLGARARAFLWIVLPFGGILAGCGGGTSGADGKAAPQIVDARPEAGWRGVMAARGTTVAVAYAGPISSSSIYLAHSNDGGATFDPARSALVEQADGTPEDVTIDGATIYVTYQVSIGDAYEVRVARSDDGGTTFAIQTAANGVGPALLASGNTLYLAYTPRGEPGDGTPHFRRSDDRGATWSASAIISATSAAGPISVDGLIDRTLSLATSGGNLYVSFYDSTSSTQRLAHSSDAGKTWTVEAGQNLLATGSLVAIGDDVLLPLVDDQNRSFTSLSRDHGATWTRAPFDVAGGDYGNYPLNDSNDTAVAGPHLASAGSKLYAIFNQGSIDDQPSRIGFARSDDEGATWPAANTVTAFAPDSTLGFYPAENAQMVVSTAALLIAAYDGMHLRVLRSTDDGATWR